MTYLIPPTLVAWCFNFDLYGVKRPKLKHHATKVGGISPDAAVAFLGRS